MGLHFISIEDTNGRISSIGVGSKREGDKTVGIVGVIPHNSQYDLANPLNQKAIIRLCKVAGIKIVKDDDAETQ